MKKPALIVSGILLFAFVSTYFIIPQYITAKSTVTVDATDENVFKFLVRKEAWPKWWPGFSNSKDSNSFAFNGMMYTVKKDANSYIEVIINTDKVGLDSKISYLAKEDVSTIISWDAQMQSSLNPITRILEFVRVKKEQRDMDSILTSFKAFIQKDTNVYGLHMKIEHLKDGPMLATNMVSTTVPPVETIYGMIAGLRQEISARGATETNKPMLNITKTDDNEYHVMVAVPINKEVKAGPNSVMNKLVVGGNILTTEVTGGRKTIDNALAQLQHYRQDYKLTGVAMPFELMLTDRSIETDTAKWKTKLCWPVL